MGRDAEAAAADFLRRLGYRIIERNFRSRQGEIDIIAEDGGCLVFVEVKARSGGFCRPAEAVDRGKQLRLRRAAQGYLHLRGGTAANWPPCRFDVVTAMRRGSGGFELDVIRNAFGN